MQNHPNHQKEKMTKGQKIGKNSSKSMLIYLPPPPIKASKGRKDSGREKGKKITFQVFVVVERNRVWVHSLWCGLLLFLMITIMGRAETSCENKQE